MSLFQCYNCGCVENTAPSSQGFAQPQYFDWTGIEHLAGKRICSDCGPTKYRSGNPRRISSYQIVRKYYPHNTLITNKVGNVEHFKGYDYTLLARDMPWTKVLHDELRYTLNQPGVALWGDYRWLQDIGIACKYEAAKTIVD